MRANLNQPITQLMDFSSELTPISVQGFDISGLLLFDPSSLGLSSPSAKTPSLYQPIDLVDRLQHVKDLLSIPIGTFVDDSVELKHVLEQIESQPPESL